MSRYWKAAVTRAISLRGFVFFFASTFGAAMLVGLGGFARIAVACGFEDPGSATLQRGFLNLTYPNATYVLGALTQAELNGILPSQPQPRSTKGLFGAGYRSMTTVLLRFGEQMPPQPAGDEFSFSLVLIEPMLWTRFSVRDGRVTTAVHVSGPQPGDVAVVTAETALRRIVDHRMTAGHAEELGLIRMYGDLAMIERVRILIANLESD